MSAGASAAAADRAANAAANRAMELLAADAVGNADAERAAPHADVDVQDADVVAQVLAAVEVGRAVVAALDEDDPRREAWNAWLEGLAALGDAERPLVTQVGRFLRLRSLALSRRICLPVYRIRTLPPSAAVAVRLCALAPAMLKGKERKLRTLAGAFNIHPTPLDTRIQHWHGPFIGC